MIEKKVPDTLEEAVEALDKLLCQRDKDFILGSANPTRTMEGLHHSLGRFLRNRWGLWGDSPLKQDLLNRGFSHPDDMSMYVMLTWVRSRLPST